MVSSTVPVLATSSSITTTGVIGITVVSGLKTGQTLVVQTTNTQTYKSEKAKQAVTLANDKNTTTSVKQILQVLEVDTKQEIKTADGKKVNPVMYQQLTDFVEVAISDGAQQTFETTGKVEATITIEAAKEMKKSEVLLMQINPNTGAVQFVSVDKLDKKTGEITATFTSLGAVALISKIPAVNKAVDTSSYTNREVANLVDQHKDKKTGGIELSDLVNALKPSESGEVRISENKTINPADFVSTMGFKDLAFKVGDDYSYEMEGEIAVEMQVEMEEVDWQSMVGAAFDGVDLSAAEDDPAILIDLGTFSIPDSYIVQLDPETGDMEYYEEPEIYFELPAEEEEEEDEEETTEDEEEAAEEETEEETEEEDEDELMAWSVESEYEDGYERDASKPVMKVKTEVRGAGPWTFIQNQNKR
jgi:hypothetical protein